MHFVVFYKHIKPLLKGELCIPKISSVVSFRGKWKSLIIGFSLTLAHWLPRLEFTMVVHVKYNTITKIYTNTNETNMLKTNTYQNSERKTGNPNDNWFQPGSLITTARVPWRLVIKSRGFQTLWWLQKIQQQIAMNKLTQIHW